MILIFGESLDILNSEIQKCYAFPGRSLILPGKNKKGLRRMEITYTQIGDYLYPNIMLSEDDKLPIGKYGRMRKEYLREHRPVIYNVLAVQGKLQRHLWEIDQAANE